ncbi:MAG: VanW family protein [Desulfitobacterium hafniense]|nr:VanW family protein [Desulfitobacterium hafniense]
MALSNDDWKGKQFPARKTIIITSVISLALIGLVLFFLFLYTRDSRTILPGVSTCEVEIGNLTIEEALKKVELKTNEILAQELGFKVEDQEVKIPLKDLGLELDVNTAIQQAYGIGRQGNVFVRTLEKIKASRGINFELPVKWNESVLLDTIIKRFSPYETEPTDATFNITADNKMEIIKEKVGRGVDVKTLVTEVKSIKIMNPGVVLVKLIERESPKVYANDLEKLRITGQIASFTTKFDPGLLGRTENIRLASKALDKKLIKPGETVSFNQVVGPRTVSAGYKEAMIIENGQFVPGLGGGICQVSSTLFNALLLADLEIVKRYNHALAISYVPLGQDATVAYPDVDLVFKNSTPAYILIRSKVEGDSLTFELFGQTQSKEVIITNKILSTYYPKEQVLTDESLAPDQVIIRQVGQPGYTVSTTRTVKENGSVTKEEVIAKSYYQASPRIIIVGKKP